MNVLLVCPRYPDTFWSFRHALRFVSKKCEQPPLGLLTVAALLPREWSKRLVDMNVDALRSEDIAWADLVFLGAMSVQELSAREVIARCTEAGTPVVAGGPLFTAHHDEFTGVDHFVLNEAEITLPQFLTDLDRGRPLPLYRTSAWADIRQTPMPLWELIEFRHYATMNVQYSRGCPYDCEFCDITVLFGRAPRAKSAPQIVAEMEQLYRLGWRGHLFFVDDNFIGNRVRLKREVLPAIIDWMAAHRYPFSLSTEASINLADDAELMSLLGRAGFDAVFVGIESPHHESLLECKKLPNKNRNLISSVRSIQQAGLEVQGGFIVGFDSDPPSIFETLIQFIRDTGIATAMVGLLNAPRNTRLYKRLEQEGRLLDTFTGNNTDCSINFIPKMDLDALLAGYRKVLRTIYSPREYYDRVIAFLRDFRPAHNGEVRLRWVHVQALAKSMVLLGVLGKERIHYWRLFLWSLFRRPRLFPLAITLSVYGFHFRKVFEHMV